MWVPSWTTFWPFGTVETKRTQIKVPGRWAEAERAVDDEFSNWWTHGLLPKGEKKLFSVLEMKSLSVFIFKIPHISKVPHYQAKWEEKPNVSMFYLHGWLAGSSFCSLDPDQMCTKCGLYAPHICSLCITKASGVMPTRCHICTPRKHMWLSARACMSGCVLREKPNCQCSKGPNKARTRDVTSGLAETVPFLSGRRDFFLWQVGQGDRWPWMCRLQECYVSK